MASCNSFKSSAKYWLFDLAVVATIISVASLTSRSLIKNVPCNFSSSSTGHGSQILSQILSQLNNECLKSHPEPLQFNTEALCNFGDAVREHFVKCTVKSFDSRLGAHVVTFDRDGSLRSTKVPLQNIRKLEEVDSSSNSTAAAPSVQKYDVPSPSVARAPSRNEAPAFSVGTIVELYGDVNAQFAFPAVVTGVSTAEDGSSKYDLVHSITDAKLHGVDSSFLHPYSSYESGTASFCNMGSNLRNGADNKSTIRMVPCTVVSYSDSGNGRVIYEVSLDDDRSNRGNVPLPYSRIQRIIQ